MKGAGLIGVDDVNGKGLPAVEAGKGDIPQRFGAIDAAAGISKRSAFTGIPPPQGEQGAARAARWFFRHRLFAFVDVDFFSPGCPARVGKYLSPA